MRRIFQLILAAAAACLLLGGCSVTNMKSENKQGLDYTVVKEEDIPSEIKTLIEEKKKQEFQMTYESENYLYLIKGYGQQNTGGYSIQVEELSMSDKAITLKTNLIGPSKENSSVTEPSYPYIVIKIEYREKPVQFE